MVPDVTVESIDLLGTIVEFSIGLAGFSGVVGAFIHRSGQWLYVDRFRITNLLLMSLTPGFSAFVTMGLVSISPHAIQISSAFLMIAVALLLFFIPRSRAKVPERDRHLVGSKIFIPMSSTFGLILISQALIAASIIDQYEFTIYYYALVVILLLAAIQFARLILARPEPLPDDT